MIPRHSLPQIPKEQYADFVKYLVKNGVGVQIGWANTNKLKPIQSEINRDKVDHMKTDKKALKLPVITDQNGLILDGHHRWVSLKELGEELTPCILVKCDIRKLVELGHSFEGSTTKTIHEITDVAKSGLDGDSVDEPISLIVRKPISPSTRLQKLIARTNPKE